MVPTPGHPGKGETVETEKEPQVLGPQNEWLEHRNVFSPSSEGLEVEIKVSAELVPPGAMLKYMFHVLSPGFWWLQPSLAFLAL